MNALKDYAQIIGDKKVNEIIREARPLRGKYIAHVNSTFYGGGVAEILNSLIYLMNDIGINASWRLFKGNPSFFKITKIFHNGFQGSDIKFNKHIREIYEEMNYINSVIMHLENNDLIVTHDPQVLPLIKFYKKNQPWIWRCHIDITHPDKKLWNYSREFINFYDEMIISDKKYIKNDIKTPQTIIMPSIDPLNDKNRKLSKVKINKILYRLGIKFNKPIISQISRYDLWKDQLGVLDAFKLIKKKVDCQLVLLGNSATDDPEGDSYYKKVVKKALGMKDIIILINVDDNDLVVNALQRASDIILQKSIREGFALTVSEALWKGTPVIASNIGGIPNQVITGSNGYLVNSIGECAAQTINLLRNEKIRLNMGKHGHEYVKNNFLITRHLLDYVKLLKRVMKIHLN